MNPARNAGYTPHEVLSILAVYWRRWLPPAVVLAVLAAAYALSSRPVWQALQALILRNAASEGEGGAGKFGRRKR